MRPPRKFGSKSELDCLWTRNDVLVKGQVVKDGKQAMTKFKGPVEVRRLVNLPPASLRILTTCFLIPFSGAAAP
jgi:hypothetical protein